MDWFFKQSVVNAEEKAIWKYVTMFHPMEYMCAIFFVFLFCILFWGLLLGLPVLPFITICLCIFSGLNYSGVMNNKPAICLTVVKELFKTYKITLMTIFSIFVITSAFANLGNIAGIFSIITLFLIYWGIITIDLFHANKENGLTALSSYEQAEKICNFKNHKTKHGWLYNWVIGQEGGEISKKLKKIGKNLDHL